MRSLSIVLMSLGFGLCTLGCPKRVDSQSDLDATAREKVAEARRQAQSGKSDEALKLLQDLPQDNQAVAEVLFQVGEGQLASRDFAGARKSYGDLLANFPLFDRADLAKYHLAIALIELKEYRDAVQSLGTVYPRLPEEDRPAAVVHLARAAEGARLWADAVRWRAEAMRLARDEGALKVEEQRILELLETRVPFLDVARLAQELQPDSPLWAVVQFKLAKIYAHLRDRPRMKETLELLLAKAPSSPWAPQARAMLERAERHAVARPDTIGVAVPLSGKYKAFGESVMAGLQLALADSGLKVVVKDTAGDGSQARAAIAALATDDQVLAIVGPVLSAESSDAAAEAELQETPIVTLTRSEGITEAGPWVFRNMLTSSAQARALADWATRVKGFRKFAVLYPNIPYGTELTQFFWDAIEAADGEMRGAETYDADETNFGQKGTIKKLVGRYYLDQREEYNARRREIIESITDPYRQRKLLEGLKKKLEPIVDFEALLIPDYYKNIGLIAPALAVEDVITNACDKRDIEKIAKTQGKEPRDIKAVQLLGGNGWNFNELVERGGKFVQCSVFVDGFFAASDRKETRDFVIEFKKATGKDPSLLEAEGYDTGRVLRAIVEGQQPKTRAAMREALLKVKDFPGATGRTTVNDRREFDKPLFLLTIDRDQIREIDADTRS
ncbi:MAG: penicillin-binding protein activator [Deltaproteobacteria bacterium]|nr:penicillin-binding protein activator [Deltaproteobacteria bacterium]